MTRVLDFLLVGTVALFVLQGNVRGFCHLDIHDQQLRHDVRKLPWPLTYEGGCYYECQIREAELFDENDYKIENTLRNRADISSVLKPIMFDHINRCKDFAKGMDQNRCDAAAYFVGCAAGKIRRMGFRDRLFADMLLDIYRKLPSSQLPNMTYDQVQELLSGTHSMMNRVDVEKVFVDKFVNISKDYIRQAESLY